MPTLNELREVRINKLKKLREIGIDPYPSESTKDCQNNEVIEKFEKFEGQEITLTGRIMSWREHGPLIFGNIKDQSGKIQLYIKKDILQNTSVEKQLIGYEDLNLLDIGDYVQTKGIVTHTKTGEKSLEVKELKILAKSLRPLPDKHDGLKDKEFRMRRRYVDTAVNEQVFNRFIRRSMFWKYHREFFYSKGFMEMNIPVLEHTPGGADAKPFITHMDSIDEDFYLRISQELYLKRLIGGGYEKVFEIGPRFRNEGLSDEHLPEHIAMEFYWAYADWKDGMQMIKELFDYIVDKVYEGKKTFNIRGFEVDFGKEWELIDFSQKMKENYGIDVFEPDIEKITAIFKQHNIKMPEHISIPRCVDVLWKNVRNEISGPAFLINHPKYLSPLQKPSKQNPMIVERFQPIIAGSELGNGWSEVNDPIDQFNRFSEQQALREAGDEEAQFLDIDYVEMLEYGMPPTFGYGHSERVFWFLEDVPAREGVPFPQLKYELDDTTKRIYNLPSGNNPTASNHDKNGAKSNTSSKKPPNKDFSLPKREEANNILREHIKDDYQIMHALMVAEVMSAYAEKENENKDLWYVTGLLHDLDYFEYPEEHPGKSLEWFKEWDYPEELIHAVSAHSISAPRIEPKTKLASALIAVDELTGLLYAYSLMRPEGFEGMEAKSVKKKFKDKSFAAKVDREEIMYGIEKFGIDFNEHVDFVISVLKQIRQK